MTDGKFDLNVVRGTAVFKKNLHCIAYGAFFRGKIVDAVLLVFDDLHFVPQGVYAGIRCHVVFIVIGGEAAEDEWIATVY